VKTARSVEEMAEKKRAKKDDDDGGISPQLRPPVTPKFKQRDATRIQQWQFPKGVSGNPGGVPKHDVAAELARAIIEGNKELIYKAFVKVLSKGNAYCLQVLADRGYGKLKETVRHERGPLDDVSTPDLEEQIQVLQEKLIASLREQGYVVTKPPQLLPATSDDSKVQ